jgi:hypothetical protein
MSRKFTSCWDPYWSSRTWRTPRATSPSVSSSFALSCACAAAVALARSRRGDRLLTCARSACQNAHRRADQRAAGGADEGSAKGTSCFLVRPPLIVVGCARVVHRSWRFSSTSGTRSRPPSRAPPHRRRPSRSKSIVQGTRCSQLARVGLAGPAHMAASISRAMRATAAGACCARTRVRSAGVSAMKSAAVRGSTIAVLSAGVGAGTAKGSASRTRSSKASSAHTPSVDRR